MSANAQPSESADGSLLSPQDLADWQHTLAVANYNNVLCHCRDCDREWVSSAPERCTCGSDRIESIACWQFPDG